MRLFPRAARRRWAAAAAAGALAIGVVTAPMANAGDLHDRQKNVQKQLKHAGHELDESSSQYRKATARLESAQADLDAAIAELNKVRGQLAAARVRDQEMKVKLAAAEDRLAQAEADLVNGRRDLDAQREVVVDTVNNLYQGGSSQLMAISLLPQGEVDRAAHPAAGDAGRHRQQRDRRVRRPPGRGDPARGPRAAGRGGQGRGRRAAARSRRAPRHDAGADRQRAGRLGAGAGDGAGAARCPAAGAERPQARPAPAREAAPRGTAHQEPDRGPGRQVARRLHRRHRRLPEPPRAGVRHLAVRLSRAPDLRLLQPARRDRLPRAVWHAPPRGGQRQGDLGATTRRSGATASSSASAT